MSNKGLYNLTTREITTVSLALAKAGATEEERKIFFDHHLCDRRIDAWIQAIRAGKVRTNTTFKQDLWPCTD